MTRWILNFSGLSRHYQERHYVCAHKDFLEWLNCWLCEQSSPQVSCERLMADKDCEHGGYRQNSFRRREGTMLSVETRWMERGWRNPQIVSPKRNRRSQQCKNVQNWSHNWWELLNTLGISRWGLNRALRKGPQTKLQRRKGLLLVDASIKVFIFSNVQQCSTMSNNV